MCVCPLSADHIISCAVGDVDVDLLLGSEEGKDPQIKSAVAVEGEREVEGAKRKVKPHDKRSASSSRLSKEFEDVDHLLVNRRLGAVEQLYGVSIDTDMHHEREKRVNQALGELDNMENKVATNVVPEVGKLGPRERAVSIKRRSVRVPAKIDSLSVPGGTMIYFGTQ